MKREKDLIHDIKNHLDQSVDKLTPKTLAKIRSARHEVLHTSKSKQISWVLPLGKFSVAALAVYFAVTFIFGLEMKPESGQVEIFKVVRHEKVLEKIFNDIQPHEVEGVKLEPGQVELVEILAAAPQIELFENFEFYTWLAENPMGNLDS